MRRNGQLLEARQATSRAFQAYSAQLTSTHERTIKRWTELAILGLFVVAFSLIAARVPATGDDWTWGSSIGMDRLKNGLVYYNGRYLGNLIVLLMTRLGWFTPILQGLGFALMIALILDITRNRTIIGYVTIISLVFLMPAPLWRESAVWVPGYANFATGSIVILVFIRCALRAIAAGQAERPHWIELGLIFTFAVASQLVSEHVTVYLLLASFLALAIGRITQGNFNPRLLCWSAGFGVGALLMFVSPEYRIIFSGSGTSYKRVGSQGGSLIAQSVDALRNQVATNGLLSNRALIFTIVALVVIIAITRFARSDRSARSALIFLLPAAIAALVALVVALRMTLTPVESGSTRTVVAMATLLILVLLATYLLERPSDRMIVAIAVASMLILYAPLLVVRPISPRTFLPTYALLLVIVSVFVSSLNGLVHARTLNTWLVLTISAGLIGWVHLFVIYSEVNGASRERNTSLREQIDKGASVVTMKRLPHGEWMKRPEPFGEKWMGAFKLYYDLPEGVSISITD